MAATESIRPSNPFMKQLASSDRQIRDRALTSLRTYLHRTTPFSPLELLKLWKGLFYCMWMSDKPLPQQRLARDLADLVDALRTPENILNFIAAFWKTMAREWSVIDALRMDKYLSLVRCYVAKGFEVCAKSSWDEETTSSYLAVLGEVPLEARDHRVPNGLRYHTVDVWVDELEKVDAKRVAPVEVLLEPVRRLGRDSLTKAVRRRVQEALEDERLVDWKGEEREDAAEGAVESEEHDDEFGGFDD